MLLFFLIVSTLLPSTASASFLNFSTPYTSFPIGCHNFEGLVLCANGGRVLPGAKIILFEKDPMTADDKLAEVEIQNAKFKVHVCATDFPTPNLELFFKFENACQKDASKRSGLLKEDFLMEYFIYDNDEFVHAFIKN
uniref:Uncharacterized protein n=1 Tax=Panagrolaimus sp. ES5 TaxID=591445 RepID=A0AC34F2Z4_9BILA